MRVGALAVLVAIGLLAAAGWLGSGFVLHPPWYVGVSPDGTLPRVENESWHGIDSDPFTAFRIPYEDVTFSAEDGQTLRGWFVPGRLPRRAAQAAILLVHGGGGDRRDYLRHVPLYHDAGWPVLLFDCREHGGSDGRGVGVSFGVREHRDVSSAVAWLRRARGFARVGVVGTSQGGASVILAAARDPDIDAVVAENPFASIEALIDFGARQVPQPFRWALVRATAWRTFGTSGTPAPIDVVGRIAPRPLLILHGDADSVIDAPQSERLFAAAGAPKDLWIAPGADHTQVYDVHPEEYARRVLAFFAPLRAGSAGSERGASLRRGVAGSER
ncbi:MAG: alpha/beta fold hydrolase [Myxococcota bacterium]